jgi:hypothetical protein
VIIDRVGYEATIGGWSLPPQGAALSLSDGADATDNNDPDVWCGAIDVFGEGDLGSPGAANVVCLGLAVDAQPIFDVEWVACHDASSASASAGLDLETDAWAAIVEVSSAQITSMDRVAPFAPSDSYLWHKLYDTHLALGGAGDAMPLGAAPLDDADLDTLSTWILQGGAP